MERDPIEAVVEQEQTEDSRGAARWLEDGRDSDQTEEEIRHREGRETHDGRPLERLQLGAAAATCDPLVATGSRREHRQTDGVADSSEHEHCGDSDTVDEAAYMM